MRNGKKITVILDSSHHGMRLISVCRKEETEEEAFQNWKYMYLNGIFQYIDQFNADEFIIAIDSSSNWRKQVHPYYKGLRAIKRKEDEASDTTGWFSFESYYKMYKKFLSDIKEIFPFKVIEVKYAEADDVASILANSSELKGNSKIIVTTDQDYIQLMQDPLIKIFNPITKKFMECDNPKNHLIKKILLGDKGDHVPSIKDSHNFKPEFLQFCVNENVAQNENNAKIILEHDENILMSMELLFHDRYGIKPSRVTIFSEKLANSLISENKVNEYIEGNAELKRKFIRNNKLINLTAQPKEIKERTIQQYNNITLPNKIKKLFDFFVINGFNDFLQNSTRIGNTLAPLYDK
jgi:hypothetical protein